MRDRESLVAALDHLPGCPLAIITNLDFTDTQGVDQPELAAPIIEAGFACITECYLGDNPQATPENMDFRARGLGWERTQPAFGLYNAPAETYLPWIDWPGSCDYLAEHVL